jgi:NADH-quinone oxidoreductase subunit N
MMQEWLNPSTPLALEGGVLGLAVASLVLGMAGHRGRAVTATVLIGLLGLFVATFFVQSGRSILDGKFVLDDLAVVAKQVFLAAAGISVLASSALHHPSMERRSPEYHFALLASLIGMMALSSSRDLILMFVAFELMSIPLYVLTGFQKREPVAGEAALKFFLIGTVSSALVLYGLSFVYGVTGTMDASAIGLAIREGQPLAALGLGLVLAGIGFKIAAVPFHMWVPDSYEAASTPFVAWLSVAPKAAGFVMLCRLYLQGTGMAALVWLPVLSALAAVTIVAGNLMAIPQRNIKRLLAYSGIAHIGYMLMALAAISNAGVAMLLFYVVAYLFGNMGAFLVVQAVSASERSESIDAYRGLAQRSPVLALTMLVFLLSLGGIPFVAGFWAKLYVFWAAVDRGLYGLAFLGALLTVVALYYYLLVARRMYIDQPVRPDPLPVPIALKLAIFTCAIGVIVMGLYPEPWVQTALRATDGLLGR